MLANRRALSRTNGS